ncbi:MAG: N-acetyltransferase [Nitrospinota bacterium]|nr:N-acetyltransferase [Nitrospinota bacterium]
MIRDAVIKDANAIQQLIRVRADEGAMLPRSINDIYEQLRDFIVFEEDGKIIGAAATHIVWEDIAEIRSLAVNKDAEGKGVAKSLVNKSLETAKSLGVKKVFVLTYVPEFFKKRGFKDVDKHDLPHKIWSDCIRCHKFPDCDEFALAIEL